MRRLMFAAAQRAQTRAGSGQTIGLGGYSTSEAAMINMEHLAEQSRAEPGRVEAAMGVSDMRVPAGKEHFGSAR